MPPIRKGDGTPVAPKGISQIRTGDGRILFGGVAIPDLVTDYEFESLSDNFSIVGDWSLSSGSVEGDKGLSSDSDNDQEVTLSEPGDGLDRYPDPGEPVSFLHRENGAVPGAVVSGAFDGDASWSNFDGYSVEFRDGFFLIFRHDGGSRTEIASKSPSKTNGDWFELVINPPKDENDGIKAWAFEIDENEVNSEASPSDYRTTEIDVVEASDEDAYRDQRGVGAVTRSTDSGLCQDLIRCGNGVLPE